MPINYRAMSIDEREECQKLLSEALNGDRQPNAVAVARAEQYIAEADAKGRDWPDEIRRQALRALLRGELKRIGKDESSVTVAYDGRLIGKSARRGVTVRRADGTVEHQQRLWSDMTWEQYEEWRDMNESQIGGLLVNRQVGRKLSALHARYPKSKTVGEALRSAGTTLEELLGEEKSA